MAFGEWYENILIFCRLYFSSLNFQINKYCVEFSSQIKGEQYESALLWCLAWLQNQQTTKTITISILVYLVKWKLLYVRISQNFTFFQTIYIIFLSQKESIHARIYSTYNADKDNVCKNLNTHAYTHTHIHIKSLLSSIKIREVLIVSVMLLVV